MSDVPASPSNATSRRGSGAGGARRRRAAVDVTRDRVSAILYPVATFTLLLLAWQFLVRMFGVPEYILPVPSEFLAKLVESRGLIWQHTLVTANEILLGFLLAAPSACRSD